MNMSRIFDVFSRRARGEPSVPKPLTPEFRNRVLMKCRDEAINLAQVSEFWTSIHTQLTYLHGSPRLSQQPTSNVIEDVASFVTVCSDAHFLDFVEFVLRTQVALMLGADPSPLVSDFNLFLAVDDLPYAVTQFVWEHGVDSTGHRTTRLTAYPKVIRKDSEIMHTHAIAPTLTLLSERRYSSANAEFLEALQDYRKGDLGDCLTKCGSAFESTLKIICAKKHWAYKEEDTAATLLRTVFEQGRLDSFLEQPLLIVATLRNRLSKSHGAGTAVRKPGPAKAEYAINATAAAILLLVKECD